MTAVLNANSLPGPRGRELAIADAGGEALRIGRDRVFAVGSDQFGEGGEQACLCQAVAIDPIVARLGPGLVEIAEGCLLLFLIGQRIAGGSKRRWMAHETRQAVARSVGGVSGSIRAGISLGHLGPSLVPQMPRR